CKPWMDKRNLLPSQKFEEEIRKSIRFSVYLIACCSSSSVSKEGYFQREQKLALDTLTEIPEGHIFVIPVRIDECNIPESIRHLHYVDWFAEEARDKIEA